MAEAGHPAALRPLAGDQLVGSVGELSVPLAARRVDHRGDGVHRRLHRGAVELAEGQQPGGGAGLQGGTARDGGAGGEGRRGAGPVVDAGHHHGVDEPGRGRIGQVAGVEEVDHGGERDRADELGEVVAADRDAVGGGLGERRPPRRCSGGRVGCVQLRLTPYLRAYKKTILNYRL